MLERWVSIGLVGSKGKIYQKFIDDIMTAEFAEEYDNGMLCEVTPEGWEAIYWQARVKKAA
jgi:hypothetical protein